MKKEKIISISLRNIKYFYEAVLIATQKQTAHGMETAGKIPDGEIVDFRSTIETTLLYKDGKMLTTANPEDTKIYNQYIKKPLKQTRLPLNTPPQHVKQGKTYSTLYSERIFYEDGKEVARQSLDFNGNIMDSSGEPFTGDAKEFYPDGSLKQEAYFNKGIMEGEVKTYDKTGRTISVKNYKNGLRHGTAVIYNFTNGILNEQHVEYENGKLNGTRKSFNINGGLMGLEHFKNDKLDGLREIYFLSGKVQTSVMYANDMREGKRTTYYENGNVVYEEFFKHNMLNGPRKGFYPDGKLYLEENYKDNLLDGERRLYNEDGEVTLKEFYKEGLLQRN